MKHTKKRGKIYISIQENRVLHTNGKMKMYWYGCVQEVVNGKNYVRGYYCSQASILRLAKFRRNWRNDN